MCKDVNTTMPIQIFANPMDKPADILDSAASVTRFLADISPWLNYNSPDAGLSQKGAYGLCLILQTLENTIEAAAERL